MWRGPELSTLTAVLTHLPASDVNARLGVLTAIAPQSRFVVCHTGELAELDRIDGEKAHLDEPTLSGPARHLQSLNRAFDLIWETWVRDAPQVDAIYLVEYDHAILSPYFDDLLRELAQRTGADLLGHDAADRTATNDEHYIRFRRDPALLAHLNGLSVREDKERIFGCLGTGIWLTRRALAAYVAVGDKPPCYCETYVPTLVHHLGMRVVDVDAHSDLYRAVRWIGRFDAADVVAAASEGVVFVHPVKELETWQALGRDLIGIGSGR